MKRIIVCNTYYQVIFAFQLKLTIFASDYVALVLTDQSVNSNRVLSNIKRLSFFDECYYVETKNFCRGKNNLFLNMKDVKEGICGAKQYSIFASQYYDELLIYNLDIASYSFFSLMCKVNPNILCSRFEEGILSYNTVQKETKKIKLINGINKLINKRILEKECRYFYCFYPKIYEGKLETIEVPHINGERIGEYLKKAFDIKNKSFQYSEKYIFFTSVYDFEGGAPIGEYELVSEIANLVGKNNILIKKHPRDIRTVYEDNGFRVDSNSAIPWEVIQISHRFRGKTLLSINSGCIMSANLMCGEGVNSYFVFMLCDVSKNKSAINTINQIQNVVNQLSEEIDDIHIANTLREIVDEN